MTMSRPPYFLTTSKRGSDVAGGTAAALAAGSIAFRTQGQLINDSRLFTVLG
jgi:hypothetical protein